MYLHATGIPQDNSSNFALYLKTELSQKRNKQTVQKPQSLETLGFSSVSTLAISLSSSDVELGQQEQQNALHSYKFLKNTLVSV